MSETSTTLARKPLDGHPRWVTILLILLLAEVTSAFEMGMMFGALATIMRESGDPVGSGWLITAFLLVGSASAAVCARLGDLYGRRQVAVVLLCAATMGSVISALSPSLPGMIAGRAVQGLSTALLPLCVGLLREHMPARRVGVAIGWLAAMAGSTAGLGILLGGWVVDHLGWRVVFWISAAHAALAASLMAWAMPPSIGHPPRARLDILGGILFAPSVAVVLWGITKAHGATDSGEVLVIVACGLLGLGLWARHEWHHPDPMLDVRLFLRRQTGLTMLLTLFFGLGTSQVMLLVLQLAQQPSWTGIGLGLTATAAGMIKLPGIFAGLVGAPWSGTLATRFGVRTPAIVGGLVACAGWLCLVIWHDSLASLIGSSFLIAFANAALYASAVILVTQGCEQGRVSEMNGQLAVVRAVSYAAGTVVATMLLAKFTVADPVRGTGRFPAPESYRLALMFVLSCTMACLAVILALPRPQRAPRLQSA
jgi:MFS family permease